MKYHSKKIIIDGIKFDSKKEGNRYLQLKKLEEEGIISDLKLQVPFVLIEPFTLNGKKYRKTEYVADFVYFRDGEQIVEDTKGYKTELYKIKKKLMAYLYHIQIKES